MGRKPRFVTITQMILDARLNRGLRTTQSRGRQPKAHVLHLAHQAIFNGTQKLQVLRINYVVITQKINHDLYKNTYAVGALNDLQP